MRPATTPSVLLLLMHLFFFCTSATDGQCEMQGYKWGKWCFAGTCDMFFFFFHSMMTTIKLQCFHFHKILCNSNEQLCIATKNSDFFFLEWWAFNRHSGRGSKNPSQMSTTVFSDPEKLWCQLQRTPPLRRVATQVAHQCWFQRKNNDRQYFIYGLNFCALEQICAPRCNVRLNG